MEIDHCFGLLYLLLISKVHLLSNLITGKGEQPPFETRPLVTMPIETHVIQDNVNALICDAYLQNVFDRSTSKHKCTR